MSCDHNFSREKQKLYIPVCCKCGAAEHFIVKADLEQELSTLREAAQATVDEWRNSCSTDAIRALEAVLEDKAGST